MSIIDTNKIDGIGKSKNENKLALMIADHLDWVDELQHLTLLQEKINAYISFIESGQVFNLYPEATSFDGFIFEFQFMYKPTENCYKLLDFIRKSTQDLRVEIEICES